MKKSLATILTLGTIFVFSAVEDASAQYGRTKKGPDPSPAATSEQTIGVDDKISISYHRPAVKGREIWGTKLAPYGDTRPWRTGANETTTIKFSDDVTINGKALAAGTYGFHIALSEGDWTLILSKEYKSWGSFAYKKENDALRITVKPEEAPHQERLLYGFDDLEANGCNAFLHWEKKKVSFKVELAK